MPMTRLDTLKHNLQAALGADIALTEALGEFTLEVPADQWLALCNQLRTEAGLSFQPCIDLCGLAYLPWGHGTRQVAEEKVACVQRDRKSTRRNSSLSFAPPTP